MCLTAVWPSQTLLKLLPITFKKFHTATAVIFKKEISTLTVIYFYLTLEEW